MCCFVGELTYIEAIDYIKQKHCNSNIGCTDSCMHSFLLCPYSIAIMAMEERAEKERVALLDNGNTTYS